MANYSRDLLLKLKSVVHGPLNRVPLNVYNTIKAMGIVRWCIKPTHRGSKGSAKRTQLKHCGTSINPPTSRSQVQTQIKTPRLCSRFNPPTTKQLEAQNKPTKLCSGINNPPTTKQLEAQNKPTKLCNGINNPPTTKQLEAQNKPTKLCSGINPPTSTQSYAQIKKSGLCIGILNTQSVRNKIDIIRDVTIENDFDILALTETWLTTTDKDQFFVDGLSLPGYKPYLIPRKGNMGYGGVALLYKTNMHVMSKSAEDFRSFEHCKIVFNTGSKNLNLEVIYRPPPSPKNRLTSAMFFDEFTPFLQDQITSPGDMLLVGDLNFHLDVENDPDTKKFNTLMDSMNFKQHITEPTHRSGHTLDVAITRSTDNIMQRTEVSDMISDHNLIVCKVHHPKPSSALVTVTTRKLRNLDMDAVKQDIATAVCSLSESHDTAILTDQYNKVLTSVLNVRPKQPWFSDELYQAKCEKRKAERLWRRTKLTIHYELYCAKKTGYNNLLSSAKKQHYNTKIAELGHDTKAISRVIDEILHKNKEIKLPKHVSSEELANRFVTFFSDKITAIRESLPTSICTNASWNLPTAACSLNNFEPVTEEEVLKLITAAAPKSCSSDPIPSWIVKDAKTELVPLITKIVNASLSSGKVPDSMKLALITPLLKKSDLNPDILKNYRPVSNLSFVSKVMERIVATRIIKYMTDNNLHDQLQSAYKAHHSTETALLKVQNDILCALDKQGVSVSS
jgi:exonuclease III